jgi:hypothetical protein
MARYDYMCKDCELVWEIECPIADMKKEVPCPTCDKMSVRYYGDQQLIVHFDSNDVAFHSVKAKRRKINKQDFDEWQDAQKQASRDRQSEGWRQYSRIDVNHEYFKEQGLCHVMSQKEKSEAHEKAQKLANHAYNKSGIDRTKHRFHPDELNRTKLQK